MSIYANKLHQYESHSFSGRAVTREFKLGGKKASINGFVIQSNNSAGIMGLLHDTTDLRKDTSLNLKYEVVPYEAIRCEIVVIIESCSL